MPVSSLLRSRWFLALLVGAVITVGMGVGRAIVQNRVLAKEIEALEREAESIESKNGEFLEVAKRFQTSGFLEREARTKLNLQKPGEKAFAVTVVERSASSTAGGLAERETNLDRWWSYFFPPLGPEDALL
jgi:cell division protein FtsB